MTDDRCPQCIENPCQCHVLYDPCAQALEHLRALTEFAYEQGFHELGYDPLEVVKAALEFNAATPAADASLRK